MLFFAIVSARRERDLCRDLIGSPASPGEKCVHVFLLTPFIGLQLVHRQLRQARVREQQASNSNFSCFPLLGHLEI